MRYKRADLHLHTAASDGSDTPRELVERAEAEGLDVIAITDHDTLAGTLEVCGYEGSVRIISGVELSCHAGGDGGFDCHILGYGFDPHAESMRRAIAHGRQKRLEKLYKRIAFLEDSFGIIITDDELAELEGYNSVAKPHLARLIMKRGLADSVGDAIDRYLKGEHFPDDRIDASLAIDSIREAGGLSAYAHPLGGEREARLTRTELVRRVDILTRMGLDALECRYSRYSREDADFLVSVAESRGLYVSGGSDYHGMNKTVALGALSSENECEYDLNILGNWGILKG